MTLHTRNRLTSSHWDDFKQFAKAYYYDKFLAVLKPQDGLLKCVGPIEGGQCPANMVVDFTDANVLAKLECLHIDHTYDINLICRTWLDLLPQRPVSWHENIDVEVLCHVLFSNRPLYAASKSKLFCSGYPAPMPYQRTQIPCNWNGTLQIRATAERP